MDNHLLGDVHRCVLGVLPAVRGSAARSSGTDTDLARAHALLRGYTQPNRAQAPLPIVDSVHRPGTEGLRRGLRCRHRGRRDIHRRPRRHRSLADRVRAPGHLATGQGLRRRLRRHRSWFGGGRPGDRP